MAVLTAEDRALFKRCRRAWDLGASGRRNLEPMVTFEPLDVDRAIRDALAVYYFPGMWDWSRAVVIPLVAQALDKALAAQRDRLGAEVPRGFDIRADAARQLLRAYVEWSPTIERLAPVLVEVDYAADLPDPEGAGDGLFTSSGRPVSYRGRLDLLAIDENDAYWIVRHHVVDEWTPLDTLLRDEVVVAACWAWAEYYIGMEIAGTIHNEMRLPNRRTDGERAALSSDDAVATRSSVAQHEASGGGRSVPQHRRLYARSAAPVDPPRVVRDDGLWFRRTWIRRTPDEITHAARQLASEAREMFRPDVAVYPSPSETACVRCAFAAPCLALYEGREPEAEAILESSYRPKPSDLDEVRLGGKTWSVGRGAAPPQFSQG
jgi:hypothetical protein